MRFFRRDARSRDVRAAALAGGLMLAAVAVVAPPLAAEAPSGHHSLSPNDAASLLSNGNSAAADEASARELLDFAEADLSRGETGAGQRLLEILIARHPASEAARVARRRIVAVYLSRGIATETAQVEAAARPTKSERTPAPAVPAAPRVELPDAAQARWQPEVHRDVALGDELFRRIGDRVFFSDGSADLGSRARGVIAAQAEFLRQNPHLAATIEGHADDAGDAGANETIAAERAEAVRRRLVAEGIAPDRIAVVAMGTSERIAECADAACAAQNRRAVTIVRERLTAGTAHGGALPLAAGPPR